VEWLKVWALNLSPSTAKKTNQNKTTPAPQKKPNRERVKDRLTDSSNQRAGERKRPSKETKEERPQGSGADLKEQSH
jgi:hypothetical protein